MAKPRASIGRTLPSSCTGGDSCCTKYNKCGEQEGDCDRDSDCLDGLKCGYNYCAERFNKRGGQWDSTDDCCYQPGRTKLNEH